MTMASASNDQETGAHMTSDQGQWGGERGAGPALVFIHGSGDSGRCWNEVIQNLGEWTNAAVALDLPGHGARMAQPLPSPPTVSEYAAGVRRDLERLGLAHAILVGHSLGSAIALRLALDSPGIVWRLALIGAGARLRVQPALLELARSDQDTAWQQLAELGHAPEHSDMAHAYVAASASTAPGVLYNDLAACDGFDVMAEIGDIQRPALVVVGEADRLTPPKYATYLAEHLPHASLVTLPGVGHYVMDEAPEAVASGLSEWLGAS
jgi:pimeloyl-ACP methyl ester carboxylesterase